MGLGLLPGPSAPSRTSRQMASSSRGRPVETTAWLTGAVDACRDCDAEIETTRSVSVSKVRSWI